MEGKKTTHSGTKKNVGGEIESKMIKTKQRKYNNSSTQQKNEARTI
jgi:hypothetical protein